MNKVLLHIANILVLVILSAFILLVLWSILYPVQFLRRNNIWRSVCFAFMLVILYLWVSRYGALLLRTLGV
ncbi:hypothetical protein SAMN04488072_110131 [Lentibacillus halodurans]|uniref:Uncharacterized protein n=1 Tax=Lentibacillus halodurans TaxID=237679 RepID=A0A1I0ZCH4_9BACI|nr:hypothetical protein SAMN04488072_110131 [Lentibacillus halodurans]